MKPGINTKHLGVWRITGSYINGSVSIAVCRRSGSPAIGPREYTRRKFWVLFVHFGKIVARAFWKLRQFSKRVIFQKRSKSHFHPNVSNRDLSVGSRSPSQLSYRDSMLTGTHWKCLCLSTCIIFNPSWIFSPCNMFMCTYKTCFAGVGTWPKPIFRIRISCLSYPCESKKIRIFCQQIRLRFPV